MLLRDLACQVQRSGFRSRDDSVSAHSLTGLFCSVSLYGLAGLPLSDGDEGEIRTKYAVDEDEIRIQYVINEGKIRIKYIIDEGEIRTKIYNW